MSMKVLKNIFKLGCFTCTIIVIYMMFSSWTISTSGNTQGSTTTAVSGQGSGGIHVEYVYADGVRYTCLTNGMYFQVVNKR